MQIEKAERPIGKVHPGSYNALFLKSLKWLFKSYWNVTLWEITFWPVHFHHHKTRNRAAIKAERNDEGQGPAKWHLQGHCVTKELSSCPSKRRCGFVCQLVLIRIFLLFLLLSWFPVRWAGLSDGKLVTEHQRTKFKEICKYVMRACEAWVASCDMLQKEIVLQGQPEAKVWSGWKLSLECLLFAPASAPYLKSLPSPKTAPNTHTHTHTHTTHTPLRLSWVLFLWSPI